MTIKLNPVIGLRRFLECAQNGLQLAAHSAEIFELKYPQKILARALCCTRWLPSHNRRIGGPASAHSCHYAGFSHFESLWGSKTTSPVISWKIAPPARVEDQIFQMIGITIAPPPARCVRVAGAPPGEGRLVALNMFRRGFRKVGCKIPNLPPGAASPVLSCERVRFSLGH